MCSIDLDPCEVWSETPRLARKQHRCDGCGADIKPGDAYLSHFDIFEGEPNTEKACFACWWDRQIFADAHGMSFAPSALVEQVRECIDSDRSNEWRSLLASVLARYRRSPSRYRRLRERAERIRMVVLETLRRWPGVTDVATNDGDRVRFRFPGGRYFAAWRPLVSTEVDIDRDDMVAWLDFSRHTLAR